MIPYTPVNIFIILLSKYTNKYVEFAQTSTLIVTCAAIISTLFYKEKLEKMTERYFPLFNPHMVNIILHMLPFFIIGAPNKLSINSIIFLSIWIAVIKREEIYHPFTNRDILIILVLSIGSTLILSKTSP